MKVVFYTNFPNTDVLWKTSDIQHRHLIWHKSTPSPFFSWNWDGIRKKTRESPCLMFFPEKYQTVYQFFEIIYIYIYKYIISLMFINICISRNFQALVFFSVTLLFWKKKHHYPNMSIKKTHFPHSKMDHWLILEPWKTNPRPALGARRRSRSRFRVRMDFLRRQGDRIGKVDQWQTTHRKVNQLRHGGFFRTPLREGC